MGYSKEFGSLQKELLDVTLGAHGVKTLFLGQIKKLGKNTNVVALNNIDVYILPRPFPIPWDRNESYYLNLTNW